MTSNQIQIVASGAFATVLEGLGKIASQPPETYMQIPQLFPEQIRGYLAFGCQILGGISLTYALFVAHKNPIATPAK